MRSLCTCVRLQHVDSEHCRFVSDHLAGSLLYNDDEVLIFAELTGNIV